MEYQIVEQWVVAGNLASGWKLYGSPIAIIAPGNLTPTFWQAMVKENTPPQATFAGEPVGQYDPLEDTEDVHN